MNSCVLCGRDQATVLAIGSTIIDITADQFGGPAVYVGPPRPPWELSHDDAL
jgi:hypothetical protein